MQRSDVIAVATVPVIPGSLSTATGRIVLVGAVVLFCCLSSPLLQDLLWLLLIQAAQQVNASLHPALTSREDTC